MRAQQQFFTSRELKQPELTDTEKNKVIKKLIHRAELGDKYLYGVNETAGLLNLSIDEIQGLIYSYKLDCTCIRSSLRIPWWSICEYLIDPAFDIDEAVYEYMKSIPNKSKNTA